MDKEKQSQSLMHDLTEKPSFFTKKMLTILLVVAFLGIGTGFFLSRNANVSSNPGMLGNIVSNAAIKKGESFGSNDTETYKDIAEGKLKEGGIEGEGQYHLVRSGGDSQNVYLTSSLIDLSKFLGRNIKVWGQTQKAQKAGWLMDVGRVEVL